MDASSAILVITTLPDGHLARELARQLVAARLAACVNVMAPCQSIYHWQDQLHEDGEIPVIIKTLKAHYPLLEAFIRERHPYEVPEILAIEVNSGLPEYLAWLTAETRS